jgi:hypothetical protein
MIYLKMFLINEEIVAKIELSLIISRTILLFEDMLCNPSTNGITLYIFLKMLKIPFSKTMMAV